MSSEKTQEQDIYFHASCSIYPNRVLTICDLKLFQAE